MLENLKVYLKIKLVRFIVLTVACGFGMGFSVENEFVWYKFLLLLLGTFGIAAGSLSFNTFQEVENDAQMERTKHRPLVTGEFTPKFAVTLSISLAVLGLVCLYLVKPLTFVIGLSIIILYNGLYTLHWKKKWAFAAVPGAIPGALPITLGYSAINDNIFSSTSIYLFLLMFLWQMPHFWSLAIKYADDYAKGRFPVLPAVLGSVRTKYHISFYVWAYVFLAILSPFFVEFSYGYFLLVLPFAAIFLWRFIVFFRSEDPKSWLPFFIVTNFSMLVFVLAPLMDKWGPFIFNI